MAERFLVVGVGASGQGIARLLQARGRAVSLTDRVADPEALPEDLRHLRWLGPDPDHEVLRDVDTLVLSPGVPRDAPLVVRAERAGVRISGELEEAFRLSAVPVIAVTGTNGKSTTTRMVSWMLGRAGSVNAPAGGNLGRPYSELVLNEADAAVHVVEVSSFQGETLDTFRPRVAALLNLTPDHLERHGTLGAYADAKAAVFAAMGAGDTIVCGPGLDGCVFPPGVRRWWFANGPVDDGAWEAGGRMHVATGGVVSDRVYRFEGGDAADPDRLNAMASVAVVTAMGVDAVAAARTLRSFHGLPHRMEHVCTRDGVRWVDDSKATNVAAAVAGVGSLKRRVVLLCGGQEDHQGVAELAALSNVRLAFCLGESGPRLAAAFGSRGVLAETVPIAVAEAAGVARPGEAVVLAPGFKSFDQYSGFEARGQDFQRIVGGLGSGASSLDS